MERDELAKQAGQLRDDIKTVTQSSTPQTCFDQFRHILEAKGFDKIVMGQAYMLADKGIKTQRFFLHSGISDFLKTYLEQNYQFSDPIVLRAISTHRPFRWQESRADMTKAQIKQVEHAAEHGLKYGIVFPIKDFGGTMGFVSIGRSTDFELSDLEFLELELLCRYSYLKIDSFYGASIETSDLSLSPRETAILTHVSRGKTNWETGQIMGMSEYSIRDYLKAISARFDTANRTHTVVKAIQLGLILP